MAGVSYDILTPLHPILRALHCERTVRLSPGSEKTADYNELGLIWLKHWLQWLENFERGGRGGEIPLSLFYVLQKL